MRGAFSGGQHLPVNLIVPEEMIYGYMIHQIAKSYSINKSEAGKYAELDFWEMLSYDNLDSKKEEYYINLRNEN